MISEVFVTSQFQEFILLQLFKKITSSRFCWFLLLLVAVFLESCGLYFQYSLNLNPCIECVYERAYFLGFIVIGFIGALTAGFGLFRFICSASFLALSIGGLYTAFRHYTAYTGDALLGSCKLKASFPDFLPLDTIAPWMFKPLSLCTTKINWEFLGQSMPFWILVTFIISTMIAALMFFSCFVQKKARDFNKYYR